MEEKALKEKTEFDTSQTCISELQNKIRELEEEKRLFNLIIIFGVYNSL